MSMVKVSFHTGFKVCGLQLVLYNKEKNTIRIPTLLRPWF